MARLTNHIKIELCDVTTHPCPDYNVGFAERSWMLCVGKLTIIGSDNGLSPGRCQAIIWTNAGILLIGPLGTNFNEILIGIQTFSFKKMHLKMSSAKWRLFRFGLNELKYGWGNKSHKIPWGMITKPCAINQCYFTYILNVASDWLAIRQQLRSLVENF